MCTKISSSCLVRKARVRFRSCSENCLLWGSRSLSWIAEHSRFKAGLSSSRSAVVPQTGHTSAHTHSPRSQGRKGTRAAAAASLTSQVGEGGAVHRSRAGCRQTENTFFALQKQVHCVQLAIFQTCLDKHETKQLRWILKPF